MSGINRGANDCGETGIDKNLTAYNNKNSGSFWVFGRRVRNTIQLTTFHSSTWYVRTSIASRFK